MTFYLTVKMSVAFRENERFKAKNGSFHEWVAQIVVFWVITQCSFLGGYQNFIERAVSIFKLEMSGTRM
jgi:hypothetical protein